MDGQVLGGVVVVHIAGDVEVDAPQIVHQPDKALDVHFDVVVDGNAQHLGDVLHPLLHPALAVDQLGVSELRATRVSRGIETTPTFWLGTS